MNAQPLEWNDIHLVMIVCREGSLSGAARILGVNHSTVFRRVAAIEEKLGVRLFERLPSGYEMTDSGEAMLESGEHIENEVFNLSRTLIGNDLQLNGAIRVAVPDALLTNILMPHLTIFTQKYPDIELEIAVSNHPMSLVKREADIAVRATTSPPDSAIGRRICSMATAIYGSTNYLNKFRKGNDNFKINDLENYTWLLPDDNLAHLSIINLVDQKHSNATVGLRCNNLPGLYEATRQSLGIAALPCFLADPDPLLERISPPIDKLSSEIWLLTHQDLKKTARIRALMDFLYDVLIEEQNLLEGGFILQDK